MIIGVRVPEAVTSVPAQQFFGLKQLQKAEVGSHVTYLGADFVDAACGVVIYTSQEAWLPYMPKCEISLALF